MAIELDRLEKVNRTESIASSMMATTGSVELQDA